MATTAAATAGGGGRTESPSRWNRSPHSSRSLWNGSATQLRHSFRLLCAQVQQELEAVAALDAQLDVDDLAVEAATPVWLEREERVARLEQYVRALQEMAVELGSGTPAASGEAVWLRRKAELLAKSVPSSRFIPPQRLGHPMSDVEEEDAGVAAVEKLLEDYPERWPASPSPEGKDAPSAERGAQSKLSVADTRTQLLSGLRRRGVAGAASPNTSAPRHISLQAASPHARQHTDTQRALQDGLVHDLADTVGQLRVHAQDIHDTVAEDNVALDEVQQRAELNLARISQQNRSLTEFIRAKTGATCAQWAMIAIALATWVVLVLLLRLTG
ncbi:hypothetical protein CDCA_CDCA17G4366 [Cyanidium caldarium]|uniref:t-SNARE coiled-coil homology domain-containing protein n=1 Tax=Cyanidium caldarium TaxID=2771 RepID=A0AAV9J1T8_CYACA|nr:hypothetical protein CDCA_CDCA17G4366 [Cyanidium caldarium]